MPRQLEIRTTILAKKPGGKGGRKDDNGNDVYADEALQLLQEIQQLKSSMQQTDEKILGTYRKSPSKPKKKPRDEPTKTRTAYDVIYPSISSDHRDAVVSHCLNPPGGLLAVPRRSTTTTTTFTSAPEVLVVEEASGPAASRLNDSGSAIRVMRTLRTLDDDKRAAADVVVHPSTNRTTTTTTSYKRVYASRASSCSDLSSSSGEISHRVPDDQDEQRQQVDDEDRPAPPPPPPPAESILEGTFQEEEKGEEGGENIRHVPTMTTSSPPPPPQSPLRQTGPSERPLPDDSGEGHPPLDETPADPDPVGPQAKAEEVGRKKERVRHYDPEEIRKYMQKQKKERKEKQSASPPKVSHACSHHHSRNSPSRRAELGLPSRPLVLTKRTKPVSLGQTHTVLRDADEDENWGPYEAPNFMEALAANPPPDESHPKPRKGSKAASREKSIQTEEAGGATYQMDEATQVSLGRRDDSDDWLHALPSARVDSSLQQSALAGEKEKLGGTVSSSPDSSGLDFLRRQRREERPTVPKPPQPVANLLRQIEDLEHYIGNLLEAPPFQALTQPPIVSHPPTIRTQLPAAHPPPPAPVRIHHQSTPLVAKEGKLQTPPQPEQPEQPEPSRPHRSQPPKPQAVASPLDTTTSTDYRPLPEHFAEFIKMSKQTGKASHPAPPAFLSTGTFRPAPTATDGPSRPKPTGQQEEVSGLSSFFQLPPTRSQRPPPPEDPPQQTYFRDFNEILRMDPNPLLTERSNSWKRVPRSSSRENPAALRLPPSAPYNILTAIGDELAKAQEDMDRIPTRFSNRNSSSTTSDSDFPSHISVSDASGVTDPVVDHRQPPKNGSGSRAAHEAGSRMTAQAEPPQNQPAGNPLELDTTYLTLTPQYTSFDTTNPSIAPGLHPNSSEVEDGRNKDASMFSARLSPIPRAVSPLSLVSDNSQVERKQSTSSSDRSEHDRSLGDRILEENPSRMIKTPSPTRPGAQPRQDRTPDDLLSRLRSELLREESLQRSLHHVERLAESTQEQEKRFRIQFDPQTRSFFESQAEALRAIAQEVRGSGPLAATQSTAYLQGSQAALEADRIQSRSSRVSGAGEPSSKQEAYSSNFEEPSARSSPEIATESWVTSESNPSDQPRTGTTNKKQQQQPGSKRAAVSDSESDTSVLPPKAVDILLQEEAKQQRLLLKLREKAQVEKTLAELELLQMQKRILRAQGEREKAASIKKKQRGLLLKLQEERNRIEALRRQHKKSKGQADHLVDSTFWETDWSTASASTASAAGASASAPAAPSADNSAASIQEVSVLDQADDESSSSTLQPVSEVAQIVSGRDAEDDDGEVKEASQGAGGSAASANANAAAANMSKLDLPSEGGGGGMGNESMTASAASSSNLRLRAPLSPRTATTDNIRVRMKLRSRHHSSGSDDSINLSQTETASDVSDVESRLLALADQLHRRQAEAQRLKSEHKRISKEKLKAQESALIKQIEVYDRCISDLRTQLDHDVDAEAGSGTTNGGGGAILAVRPVIRQPRAQAKSPTPARADSDARGLSEPEGSSPRKAAPPEPTSNSSSIATEIRSEAEEEVGSEIGTHPPEVVEDAEKSIADSEELSTDPSLVIQDNAATEASDSGRADPFNQTMIIKSDSQVKDELAEEISKSILDHLVEETIHIAAENVAKSRSPVKSSASVTVAANTNQVLQRVSVMLSAGSDQKSDRSQLYLTTTFDVSSSPDEEAKSPGIANGVSAGGQPYDVNSAEGRNALESKLSELQIENDEWMDDDLQAVPISPASGETEEDRERVIQEAEALEREQKRIEQEIQKLSSSGSLLYLQREIPNKPPPPYTPPGQALSWQKIRAASVEIQRIAPKTKEEVSRYTRRFTEFLLDRLDEDPSNVPFPEELYAVDYQVPEQPAECQTNCRAFMSLLAHLSRAFLSELSQRATFIPGRNPVAGSRPIRSRGELADAVEEAVLIQFNHRPRLQREGQLAKWSQKKRDRVDEILVKELQTEEKLWTDFSTEEAQVKRQTADAILDMVLEETVEVYKRAILHQSKRTAS